MATNVFRSVRQAVIASYLEPSEYIIGETPTGGGTSGGSTLSYSGLQGRYATDQFRNGEIRATTVGGAVITRLIASNDGDLDLTIVGTWPANLDFTIPPEVISAPNQFTILNQLISLSYEAAREDVLREVSSWAFAIDASKTAYPCPDWESVDPPQFDRHISTAGDRIVGIRSAQAISVGLRDAAARTKLGQRFKITPGRGAIRFWLPLRRVGTLASSTLTAQLYLDDVTLTGTVAVNGTTTVTGSGTLFLTETVPGANITIGGYVRVVSAIASDTSLTLTEAHPTTASGLTAIVADAPNKLVAGFSATADADAVDPDLLWTIVEQASTFWLLPDTEYWLVVSADYGISSSNYLVWPRKPGGAMTSSALAKTFDGTTWSLATGNHFYLIQTTAYKPEAIEDYEYEIIAGSSPKILLTLDSAFTDMDDGVPVLLTGQAELTGTFSADTDTTLMSKDYLVNQTIAYLWKNAGAPRSKWEPAQQFASTLLKGIRTVKRLKPVRGSA